MGLGILDDTHLEHVPGTSVFSDDANAAALRTYEGIDLNRLKHGTGKNAHIVLVPQPSDDPNDPLNWPTWKKHCVFLVLIYGTVICGALGPLVSADIVAIAKELDRSIQAISRALGSSLVVALAFSTIVWSVMSLKLGKRPVFLLSTLLMFAGSMITSFTSSYSMLLGKDILMLSTQIGSSRVLQGIGQAVLEFLVGASIADIYYTHERGIPVALWNLALINGINITPPIAGQVIEHLGWRYAFKIFSIACALLFIIQFFFMPETSYQRKPLHPALEKKDDTASQETSEKAEIEAREDQPIVPRKKTYLQELKVYNGIRPTRASIGQLLIRPFIACLTPVCLWAGLVYGVAITWLVLLATSVSQLFSAPPYSFKASSIGLTYMSPFIACLIGAGTCGPLTDFVARKMSHLNGGVFEPEFRLVLVSVYGFFGALGFFGWGISANIHDPWIGPVVFFGVINFGVTVGCAAAIGYVVDAHRQSADSALGGVIFFKNIFSFIITLFINDWLQARGILSAFCTVAGIVIFTSLLTIPMYIYGKRARSWIHRTFKFDDDETSAIAH